jgi:hypothetical protein
MDPLERMMQLAGLIGRMESSLVQCDKIIAYASTRIYDRARLQQAMLAQNEIGERLREVRQLFPDHVRDVSSKASIPLKAVTIE